MKTILIVLVAAFVGIAMVPEASAHTCKPGTFLTLPISFSYDNSHNWPIGHACLYVGNTPLLP